MVGKLAAAIGLVSFGYLADQTSFAFTWLIAGFILLSLIPIYLKIKSQETQLIS